MKIKREIDVTNAIYSIEGINSEQFSFIRAAINHYTNYTMRHIPDDDKTPLGELFNHIEKMANSSITII